MKRVRTLVILLITLFFICTGPLFSAVKFSLAPINTLFREFASDPFAPITSFRIFSVKNTEGIPSGVLVAEDNEYKEMPFAEETNGEHNTFYHFKTGANIGLLRIELGFFQIESYIHGGLNTVFECHGATDTLGFDGQYGAGVTIRLWDKFAMRGGLHHFSGHWGDEILTRIDGDIRNIRLLEYTRDNSWLASLSYEPNEKFRYYTSVELPQSSAWIRPGAHVPFHTTTPNSPDKNQHDHITGQENVNTTITYPQSYKALRIQAGTELRLPLFSLGSLFLATDIQLHQDGKTKHQVNSYDINNPWEVTCTIGGGLEFNRGLFNRKFRLEVYYHDGRFPLLNYFYKRSRYVTLGLSVSG
ncbi:MAG: hypothetical protein PHR10_08220 [Sphaerochaetaceae bacterium]|nr:hypothetical protein [Sphaerochaetaceae bacterium]MDD4220152.1 hypothetical protein [Sphaerochaetaceae bacterium]